MSDRARPPLDPTRTAVLVIDMQRDFLEPGAPVATPGGLELVPRINSATSSVTWSRSRRSSPPSTEVRR